MAVFGSRNDFDLLAGFFPGRGGYDCLIGLARRQPGSLCGIDFISKIQNHWRIWKIIEWGKNEINNLDLNLDKKVDFIKVITNKKDDSYTFVLQVDVSKTEKQDVAVILVDKDKNKKVTIQIVGDEDLYGKDYVIEPKGTSSVTANPGYTGADPVLKSTPATTTVVVESAPIVQYVYSPAYVPYYPPYYYGYYPPYFAAFTVMAVGIYRHNNYYYHGGYYGGHYGGGNTVIINNGNHVNHNNYTGTPPITVANNKAKGNYGSGSANRPGGGTSASTRPAGGAGGASCINPTVGRGGGCVCVNTSIYISLNTPVKCRRLWLTKSIHLKLFFFFPAINIHSMGSSRTRSGGSSYGGYSGGGMNRSSGNEPRWWRQKTLINCFDYK